MLGIANETIDVATALVGRLVRMVEPRNEQAMPPKILEIK